MKYDEYPSGKEYVVEFWYNTDLRTNVRMYAPNELIALILALGKINVNQWVTEEPFKIKIRLAR